MADAVRGKKRRAIRGGGAFLGGWERRQVRSSRSAVVARPLSEALGARRMGSEAGEEAGAGAATGRVGLEDGSGLKHLVEDSESKNR